MDRQCISHLLSKLIQRAIPSNGTCPRKSNTCEWSLEDMTILAPPSPPKKKITIIFNNIYFWNAWHLISFRGQPNPLVYPIGLKVPTRPSHQLKTTPWSCQEISGDLYQKHPKTCCFKSQFPGERNQLVQKKYDNWLGVYFLHARKKPTFSFFSCTPWQTL